jgi:tRNA(fMet)-specific endonuclease VapC
MNYLLDTCVLSEFIRHQPDERVIQWMDGMDESKLFLSVVTIGEIHRGIERLPESRRKNELIAWLNDVLVNRFDRRIVNIDVPSMFLWGSLTVRMESKRLPVVRKPMSVMDSLIAASALHQNMIIVTRNVTHFQSCGVQVVNPWE